MQIKKILVFLHIFAIFQNVIPIQLSDFTEKSTEIAYELNNKQISFMKKNSEKSFTLIDPIYKNNELDVQVSDEKLMMLQLLIYSEIEELEVEKDILFQISVWNLLRYQRNEDQLFFTAHTDAEKMNAYLRETINIVALLNFSDTLKLEKTPQNSDGMKNKFKINSTLRNKSFGLQSETTKLFVMSESELKETFVIKADEEFFTNDDVNELNVSIILDSGENLRISKNENNTLILTQERYHLKLLPIQHPQKFEVEFKSNFSFNNLFLALESEGVRNLELQNTNYLEAGLYQVCATQNQNENYEDTHCQNFEVSGNTSIDILFLEITGTLTIYDVAKTKNIKTYELFISNLGSYELLKREEIKKNETTTIIFDNLKKGNYLLKQVPEYFVSNRTEKTKEFTISAPNQVLTMEADDNELAILVETGEPIALIVLLGGFILIVSVFIYVVAIRFQKKGHHFF